MKRCPKCGVTKDVEAFSRQTKSLDGRYPYCKECTSMRTKAAYRVRGKRSWVNDKTCAWCKTLKPRIAFRTDATGKVAHRCIECETEIAEQEGKGLRRCNICREWLPTDRFYASKLRFPHVTCVNCITEQNKKPAYVERKRNYLLLKEYGITLDQYKELLERQGHRCPVCQAAFEPGNYSYHVDHAHSGKFAGRIRAILHSECNRNVMWGHEDSAQLRAAADLIDNPLTDWVVPEHMIDVKRKDRE